MPRPDYKTCRECERHTDVCGPLSNTRLCGECAERILAENIVGLVEHKGLPLQRWRLGMISCAGGIPSDDLRELP
jgi:hypothetical protein